MISRLFFHHVVRMLRAALLVFMGVMCIWRALFVYKEPMAFECNTADDPVVAADYWASPHCAAACCDIHIESVAESAPVLPALTDRTTCYVVSDIVLLPSSDRRNAHKNW